MSHLQGEKEIRATLKLTKEYISTNNDANGSEEEGG